MYENWKVAMVGAGAMGSNLGMIFASKGFDVTLIDRDDECLSRAANIIDSNCDYQLSQGLVDAQYKQTVKQNVKYALEADMEKVLADKDLVVEAVFEDAKVKGAVYEKLNKYCRPDCILCSNTSASNVFEYANVDHPERFLITHWFNPPFVMRLVEIVMGPHTSDEVTKTVKDILTYLGKDPVVLKQYIPGFIVNRLTNALMREGCSMVKNGWTTPEEIDLAVRAINGVRYAFEGPFAMYDVIGWDLVVPVAKDILPSLCSDTDGFKLAEDMAQAGTLGIKTGKGAYDYSGVNPQDYMNKRATKIIKMHKAIDEL